MTTTVFNSFNGYTDAFADTLGNVSAEEHNFQKLARKVRALKKKNKKLKRTIEEQRAAEEKRNAEEQRTAGDEKKKEQSIFSKIGDAFVKAIPTVLTAVVSFFVKKFFSRQKEYRCA